MSRAKRLLIVWFAGALLVSGCFGGAGSPGGGTSLTGTLRNEYGHPVPGALLSVGALTATTGRDGSFRLAGLPSGSQTVAFRAKGYLDRDLTVTIKAGQSNQLTEPAAGGAVILKTIHSAARSQAALSQAMRETQQHTACDSCHSVAAPVGTKLLDANTQALCTQAGCHAAPGGGSWEHPAAHLDNSVIKPAGELAQYDQIGCLRCHVSHAATPGGSLTPGYPATVDNTGYEAFCTDCHNATNPANTYKPATHYGSNCTACHKPNGIPGGHKACTRTEAGCHALSSTIALNAKHRVGTTPCANCHDTANGPTANYLLKGTGDQLCLSECHNVPHDGIEAEFAAAGSHGAESPEYRHDLPCRTCHNVHTMDATKVTDPFTKQPFAYDRLNSGAYCLLCHGLGNGFAAAADLEAGLPAVEQWPGAVNVMPEFYTFQTRVTTFWLGNRYSAEGGLDGPWYDAGLNGHYAHWGDEYVTNPPAGWPYVLGSGSPSLPDPCIMCHGVHASADPNLVRPQSGPYADWTLYRTDHQYDCHYSCHSPLAPTASLARTKTSAGLPTSVRTPGITRDITGQSDHSVHSIEEATAKTNTLPFAVLLP